MCNSAQTDQLTNKQAKRKLQCATYFKRYVQGNVKIPEEYVIIKQHDI